MKQHDVIVVGASVAGALAAKEAAKRGLETVVLEEHYEAGKKGKCAGLVSKTGLERLDVDYRRSVLNEIRGARFVAGKTEFRVGGSETKAYVVDRQAFDEECVNEALKKGAFLYLKNKVASFRAKPNSIAVKASKTFYCSAIVGADGANSAVAAHFNFPQLKQLLAYQSEWSRINVGDSKNVSVILDPVFKGFFAWIVPVNEGSARIGFATSDYENFQNAKKTLFACNAVDDLEISKGRKASEFHALLPQAPRALTQKDKVLLAGDAAGQVKATSGGGIVFGGLCAKTAGECLAEHLLEENKLDYEKTWRARYGGVLKKHFLLRKFCDALPSAAVELCAAAAGLFGLNRLVDRFGDMDFLVRGQATDF